jgi:hypothetical protein
LHPCFAVSHFAVSARDALNKWEKNKKERKKKKENLKRTKEGKGKGK